MARKGKESAEELLQAMFNGGARAARLYNKATGCHLDGACEYLLTANIFERLAKLRGAVLLEVPVEWARKEAGAVRCGPKSERDRLKGRYDLVHYWVNNDPRAAIEVKSGIQNVVARQFTGDFHRLTRTLAANDSSSYQFCAFFFYAHKPYPTRTIGLSDKKIDAKAKLDTMMGRIDELAGNHVARERKPLIHRFYKSAIQASTDPSEGVWQFGVIVFAHKKRQNTFPHDLMT